MRASILQEDCLVYTQALVLNAVHLLVFPWCGLSTCHSPIPRQVLGPAPARFLLLSWWKIWSDPHLGVCLAGGDCGALFLDQMGLVLRLFALSTSRAAGNAGGSYHLSILIEQPGGAVAQARHIW